MHIQLDESTIRGGGFASAQRGGGVQVEPEWRARIGPATNRASNPLGSSVGRLALRKRNRVKLAYSSELKAVSKAE